MIIRQNNMRTEAMELREAKNPLVVENNPIRAKAKVGRLMSGDKNTFSKLFFHENKGAKPAPILPKKCPGWKSLASNNSIMVS